MLIISKKQIDAFKNIKGPSFEDSALGHLRGSFPKRCEILEESALRSIIKFGRNRANDYDFHTERGMILFIDLMFLFGSRFDEDPQLPWAEDILTHADTESEIERIENLNAEANACLDAVSGEDNQYIDEALRNIRNEPMYRLDLIHADDFEKFILSLLHRVFPTKYNYLKEDGVLRMIERGKEMATEHGMTTVRGTIIYIGLQFMLGTDFATDPQYPWVEDILNTEEVTSPALKAKNLYQASMDYLDQWI